MAAAAPTAPAAPGASATDAAAPAAGTGALLGTAVALGMSECDVVFRAGQPNSVQIGQNPNGDRTAVLTYNAGPRPGIYHFERGELMEMDAVAPARRPRWRARKSRRSRPRPRRRMRPRASPGLSRRPGRDRSCGYAIGRIASRRLTQRSTGSVRRIDPAPHHAAAVTSHRPGRHRRGRRADSPSRHSQRHRPPPNEQMRKWERAQQRRAQRSSARARIVLRSI